MRQASVGPTAPKTAAVPRREHATRHRLSSIPLEAIPGIIRRSWAAASPTPRTPTLRLDRLGAARRLGVAARNQLVLRVVDFAVRLDAEVLDESLSGGLDVGLVAKQAHGLAASLPADDA